MLIGEIGGGEPRKKNAGPKDRRKSTVQKASANFFLSKKDTDKRSKSSYSASRKLFP